jgi:DNA modification methylase
MNRILQGDTLALLSTLPEASVDLIFADPPYNLQLKPNTCSSGYSIRIRSLEVAKSINCSNGTETELKLRFSGYK